MSERDPRVDPQPGDVLGVDGVFRLEVERRTRGRIEYILTQPGARGINACPMTCGEYLGRWRKARVGAEVIKRGDDANQRER